MSESEALEMIYTRLICMHEESADSEHMMMLRQVIDRMEEGE